MQPLVLELSIICRDIAYIKNRIIIAMGMLESYFWGTVVKLRHIALSFYVRTVRLTPNNITTFVYELTEEEEEKEEEEEEEIHF